jgi:hypothetical protein
MSVVEKILEGAKQGFATALRDGKIDSVNLVGVVTEVAKRVNALPIPLGDKKAFLTLALKKAAEAAGASGSSGFSVVLQKAVEVGHDLIDAAAKLSGVATHLSSLTSFLSRCLPVCSQVAATLALDPKDTELLSAALKEVETGVKTAASILESLTVRVSETGERLVEVAVLVVPEAAVSVVPVAVPEAAVAEAVPDAAALVKEVQEDIPAPSVSDKESSPEASPVEVPVLNIRSEAL